MTVRWAVAERRGSSATVSRYMIAGVNTLYSTMATAGQNYLEHYLTPDGGELMVRKAMDLKKALIGNPPTLHGNANSYWLLQPRDRNSVPLSAVLAYLRQKFGNEQVDVWWTCCRSPIGDRTMERTNYDKAANQYRIVPSSNATDSKKISAPLAIPPTPDQAPSMPTKEEESHGILSLGPIQHTNCTGGVISLWAGNDNALTLAGSWPGIGGVFNGTSFYQDLR